MPNIRPLSEEYAKLVEQDLGETPERIDQSLSVIRQWLVQSPHICGKSDDQFLVGFLRGCKYSVERVKEKLDMYYTARSRSFKEMVERDPNDEKFMNLASTGIVIFPFLRHHLATEPVLVMLRASRFFPDVYCENDLFDHGLKVLEVLLENDLFTICGVNVTVDLKGLTGVHLVHLSPSFLKRMVTFFSRSAPIRIKGIHLMNVTPGYIFICNVIKSLVSEKLKARVHIHKSYADLHKHVPAELLPTEYDGLAGPIDDWIVDYEQYLMNNRKILQDCRNYGVDEMKRMTKSKFAERMTDGLDGNFRKLSVD